MRNSQRWFYLVIKVLTDSCLLWRHNIDTFHQQVKTSFTWTFWVCVCEVESDRLMQIWNAIIIKQQMVIAAITDTIAHIHTVAFGLIMKWTVIQMCEFEWIIINLVDALALNLLAWARARTSFDMDRSMSQSNKQIKTGDRQKRNIVYTKKINVQSSLSSRAVCHHWLLVMIISVYFSRDSFLFANIRYFMWTKQCEFEEKKTDKNTHIEKPKRNSNDVAQPIDNTANHFSVMILTTD